VKGRPFAPQGEKWDQALAFWQTLPTDADARFDKEVDVDGAAIAPMVRATVENVAAMGPAEALTGPIARGDQAVIRRHLEALGRCDHELLALYKTLGRRTVELALRKRTIDDAKADALRKLLDGPNK